MTDTFVLTINGVDTPNEISGTSGNDRGPAGAALKGGAGRDQESTGLPATTSFTALAAMTSCLAGAATTPLSAVPETTR